MAIENRFASEQYVLDQINNSQSDWNENNSESSAYIKNRTHYKETITLEWDGNTEGYEVYDIATEDDSEEKYIRLLDYVPAQAKDLTTLGLCIYKMDSNTIYASNELNDLDNPAYYGQYYAKLENRAEYIEICFEGQNTNQNNIARVLFVLKEGQLKHGANDYTTQIFPIGVYFTQIKLLGYSCTSLSYSFEITKRLSNDLTSKDLAIYTDVFNDIENNKVLFPYSSVSGRDNYVGPYDSKLYFNTKNYIGTHYASYAEGSYNKNYGKASHAEGQFNTLALHNSHIEGYQNSGGYPTDATVTGQGCHIEGYLNEVPSNFSKGVHVEGYQCKASGDGAHAEGYKTIAKADHAHAQNKETIASAYCSSASGLGSKATASMADAGGSHTEANHNCAFTRGTHTKSGGSDQTVVGRFNEVFDDSLFDVGNGNKDARKTAFSVKQDGSAKLQLQGTTDDSITRKDYVDGKIEEVNENILTTKDETIKEVLNITNAIDSWESVQKIVRAGYAPLIFNIGDQLTCNSEQFGELTWDIIGFDHDTPTNSEYTHSMTLQLHDVLPTTYKEFDARELIYITDIDLDGPNTYYLSYPINLKDDSALRYFPFTLPEGSHVPTGSMLYMTTRSDGVNGLVLGFIPDIYLSSVDDMICQVTYSYGLSELPEGAIYLGESNYHTGYGQNVANGNYEQSTIRTYLNSEAQYLDWEPFHNFDMPPSYLLEPGFLYGIDPEFKNVLGEVSKSCYDFYNKSIYTVNDKIFLLSSTEAFGKLSVDINGNEISLGAPYPYYENNTSLSSPANTADTNRIKYNQNNIATPYFLRNLSVVNAAQSTTSTVLGKTGAIGASGNVVAAAAFSTGSASTQISLAPCCCIV